MQQVHTAETSARKTIGRATGTVGARDDRRHYGSCRRVRRPAALRKLSARETTGRATEAVGARDDRRHYGSCRRGRRPDALWKLSAREMTGGTTEAVDTRDNALKEQPVCVTSALKKGPRTTSAEPVETSWWREASGASCRTSQEPAVPREKCALKRTSHQERRPWGKHALREPNSG